MNGVQRCAICATMTSDWTMIDGRHYCDEHAAEGRRRRANYRRSQAALANAATRKAARSGNPAVRAASHPTGDDGGSAL